MTLRLFVLCALFLLSGGILRTSAQSRNNHFSATSTTTYQDTQEITQQTDLRFSLGDPQLVLPVLQVRFYTMETMELSKESSPDTDQSGPYSMVPDILGLGFYSNDGKNRFAFGPLSVQGSERRLKNIWNKALTLPESYQGSTLDIRRSTSQNPPQELAGLISTPLTDNLGLYGMVHIPKTGAFSALLGLQRGQTRAEGLRIEGLFSSLMIDESSADTWFSDSPLLPDRRQYLSALSLQWFRKNVKLVGDFSGSYTEWEGLGWYYKGAFSLGPPSLRFSGGAETIRGPFLDSEGTRMAENSRYRLRLAVKNSGIGSVQIDANALFHADIPLDMPGLTDFGASIGITKGSRFRPWWLVPQTLEVTTTYALGAALPYNQSIKIIQNVGNTRGGIETSGKLRMEGNHILPLQSATDRITGYSIDATLFGTIGKTRLRGATQLDYTQNSGLQMSCTAEGAYKTETIALVGDITVPLYNKNTFKIQFSATFTR